MRTRLPILLGLALLLSAASYAATLTDAPAAPVTSPAVADQAPAADPFLTLSDITSSAPEARAFCPCQPGVNCCGDLKLGRCGYLGLCHCNGQNCLT